MWSKGNKMATSGSVVGLFIAFFSALISPSMAVRCGFSNCPGWHCCGSMSEQCCSNNVWDFWWFWMLWVFIFVFMAACGFCCHRRRRLRNPDYIVVQGPTRGVYGTPVYGATGNAEAAPIIYGQAGQVVNGPNGPMVAGQYVQAYGATRPPAYSPAVKPPDYSANPDHTQRK